MNRDFAVTREVIEDYEMNTFRKVLPDNEDFVSGKSFV